MTTASRSNAFLDSLDLGGAIQRSLAGLAGIHGTAAFTLAVGLVGIDVVCWVFAWHYDFQPTLAATAAIAARVIPSLPGAFVPYASLISLLITLAPMLGEFCLPRLGLAGWRLATGAIYILSIFDVYTDWPNVTATMDAARGGFASFGILALPTWWLARFILLAFATHGFELLALVIGICALKLLFQARGGSAVVAAR